MNWYKISQFNPKKEVLYGIVTDDLDVYIERIPEEYNDRWGAKGGISHLDIFGHVTGVTWRYFDNKLWWSGFPEPPEVEAVEIALERRYGIKNPKHEMPG